MIPTTCFKTVGTGATKDWKSKMKLQRKEKRKKQVNWKQVSNIDRPGKRSLPALKDVERFRPFIKLGI